MLVKSSLMNFMLESLAIKKVNVFFVIWCNSFIDRLTFVLSIDANFITQVFVLTLAYLHYGPVKTFVDYRDLTKACNDFKQEIEEYERNQAANPANAAMSNMILQRGKVTFADPKKGIHSNQ